MNLLNKINDGSRVLVFCETKRGVDELARTLRSNGWHGVKAIHGDKCQQVKNSWSLKIKERDNVLREFKDGTSYIMVATDVASRGLG